MSIEYRRMAKEALMFIYRLEIPKNLKDFHVYYFPYDDSDLNIVRESVQALQSLDEIPWPSENCIILAEDPVSVMLSNQKQYSGPKILIWYIKTKESKNNILIGYVELKNNSIKINGPLKYQLKRMEFQIQSNESREGYIDKAVNFLKTQEPSAECITEQYREYLRKVCVSSSANSGWVIVTDKNEIKSGMAADILASMASIITPCSYIAKACFPNGFGFGKVKKISKNTKIITLIKPERLYANYSHNTTIDQSRNAHERRGHIRHFWKEAGIDRFKLPDTLADRLKLVKEHKVRRTYINPAWVGPKIVKLEDCEISVTENEIELNF